VVLLWCGILRLITVRAACTVIVVECVLWYTAPNSGSKGCLAAVARVLFIARACSLYLTLLSRFADTLCRRPYGEGVRLQLEPERGVGGGQRVGGQHPADLADGTLAPYCAVRAVHDHLKPELRSYSGIVRVSSI
jgi:hypothetical protein